jgi:hypothetical protein
MRRFQQEHSARTPRARPRVAHVPALSGRRHRPGLLASAHQLAAIGGDGLLEVDANPNPLREATCGERATIRDGSARLSDEPGSVFCPI